jgi:putative ABC transport system permease protein
VTPGYFETVGIPVVAGRGLEPSDRAGVARVLVVDRALAARFLAPAAAEVAPVGRDADDREPPAVVDALGQRLALDYTGTPLPPAAVVGVVGDVKHASLEEDSTPTFYGAVDQAPPEIAPFLADRMVLVVRTIGEPLALADTVRGAVTAVDPEVAIGAVRTAEQTLAASLAPRRFDVLLFAAFAAAALALACSGLYAAVADAVGQRRRGLALRMVVGAERADIVRLVMSDTARLVIAGVAVGEVLAIALARSLSTMLVRVGAADPLTWIVVPLLLGLAALAAAHAPARRASRADPLESLRQNL